MTAATSVVAIEGIGLVTGQPAQVTLAPAEAGHGIVFDVNGVSIPARPEFVINTDRGVTLGRDGQMLIIVEHFLSACAMAGLTDLTVTVTGAPELPLLDGAALAWLEAFRANGLGTSGISAPKHSLSSPVIYRDPDNANILLMALPSETLKLTYAVDFNHPDLAKRWFSWTPANGPLEAEIAPARTFGFISELPALQAQGLAQGVTLDNALGLTDDGGYTSPLRLPDEPLRHKLLDLIGDLMLCGLPIHTLQAEIIVHWGGHKAHIGFGTQLAQTLRA